MKTRVDLEIVAGCHRGLAKALEMARSDERRGGSSKGLGSPEFSTGDAKSLTGCTNMATTTKIGDLRRTRVKVLV